MRIVSRSQASRFPHYENVSLGPTVSYQEHDIWVHMRNTGFHLKAVGAWLVLSEIMTSPSSTEDVSTCPYFQIILNILTITYRKIYSSSSSIFSFIILSLSFSVFKLSFMWASFLNYYKAPSFFFFFFVTQLKSSAVFSLCFSPSEVIIS